MNTYQVMPPLTDEEYQELKTDIAAHGVLVPVEYDDSGNILDGHTRVQICEELGITDWPRVVRTGMIEAEKREHARRLNLMRRQLTQEQRRELIRGQLKETPEKSDRQIAAGLGVSDKTVGAARKELESRAEIPHVDTVTDNIGRQQPRKPVSIFLPSSKHEEKVNELIRAAADNETAQKALRSLADFDATPRTARSEFKKQEERRCPSPAPPLPDGKYPTIVADPPWRYEDSNTRAAAEKHYPTMSIEEICALPVADLAADNAHLYLWTTNSHLPEAFKVAEAWGFQYKTLLTWVKPQLGLGHYFRNATEHLLFCVRGTLPTILAGARNWFECPREEHSKKPEMFFALIEKTSPAPRLELFAREKRDGWEAWGDELV